MKQPSEEDFKAHALVLILKTRLKDTDIERTVSAIKFGYQLALQHACAEVSKATEDLKADRARTNAPR